jgi:hypothetical protein
MRTQTPLTQEKAIEYYTELQRRVSVGAHLELQHDGSYPEDDGTPESTTLESIDNLEKWAAKQGLEFCWTRDTQWWSLEPIEQWRQESVDEARRARAQLQAMQEGK